MQAQKAWWSFSDALIVWGSMSLPSPLWIAVKSQVLESNFLISVQRQRIKAFKWRNIFWEIENLRWASRSLSGKNNKNLKAELFASKMVEYIGTTTINGARGNIKMEHLNYRVFHRPSSIWLKLKQRIIYLPGAAIILYGFWLSLTTWSKLRLLKPNKRSWITKVHASSWRT